MGEAVKLNINEKELYEELNVRVPKLRNKIIHREINHDDYRKELQELSKIAHELHMSLKKSNNEPKHHGYMIENRGMDSCNPEFYYHLHPLEDLIRFINDVDANNDPEDITLNETFEVEYFTRRWGHNDTLKLKRINDGWEVSSITGTVICDKSGLPAIKDELEHDSVNYPSDLFGYIEYLWEIAESKGLTKEVVQESLTELFKWVSDVETSSPSGVFDGYK